MFVDHVLPCLVVYKRMDDIENLRQRYYKNKDMVALFQDSFKKIVPLLLPAYFKNLTNESLTEAENIHLEALDIYRNQITPDVSHFYLKKEIYILDTNLFCIQIKSLVLFPLLRLNVFLCIRG